MSDSLQTGMFYGATKKRVEFRGIVLSEIAHVQGRKLPSHTHESAYFGLLLAGSYSERCTQRTADYEPFTMGFHPPSLTHSDEVGVCGSRMFCMEIRSEALERTRKLLTSPQFVPDLCASPVTWLALRLYRHFAADSLESLETEEICSDMLQQVSTRGTTGERTRPEWLERAVELLMECYRESLTMEAIAEQVGVHPIHLARVFRQQFHCTMSEFVNRRRVQFACRSLASAWADLAEVASDAGFSDQSHMGRVFKAYTGQTPGQFRSFYYRNLQT